MNLYLNEYRKLVERERLITVATLDNITRCRQMYRHTNNPSVQMTEYFISHVHRVLIDSDIRVFVCQFMSTYVTLGYTFYVNIQLVKIVSGHLSILCFYFSFCMTRVHILNFFLCCRTYRLFSI
jgi:hypothetical protein